jgi:hypothetical protein
MSRTTVTRTIEAPLEAVFHAVAHIGEFSRICPDLVKIERSLDPLRKCLKRLFDGYFQS